MTESIYGVWYTTCDKNLVAYSGKFPCHQSLDIFRFDKNQLTYLNPIVLTDTDYKSITAYALLKDIAKEVQAQIPRFSTDIESTPNLNMCREAILSIMNGDRSKGGNDKLSKAQEMVSQASKAMQENVKSMINNQKDFSVS